MCFTEIRPSREDPLAYERRIRDETDAVQGQREREMMLW
jgi:hypothetical protein